MQRDEAENQKLDEQLDEICTGLREAVDREIESLKREGAPIYVADNGHVIDLQENNPGQ